MGIFPAIVHIIRLLTAPSRSPRNPRAGFIIGKGCRGPDCNAKIYDGAQKHLFASPDGGKEPFAATQQKTVWAVRAGIRALKFRSSDLEAKV